MPAHPESAARPRFSIISAVYNVAPYLSEYIDSIEAQTFDLGQVEVVVVDDGSTDESSQIVQDWQRRRPDLVTVLTKPNGGQASARNLGIEHARGEWVTFTDPDDVLDAAYLAEVDKSLRKHAEIALVATNRIVFNDATGKESKHALYRHFTKKNRLRNLDLDSSHFHGHAPCAFFRLDVLRSEGIRFDERVRPTFEDGHFCCSYLLRAAAPYVAYLATARYYYRKRSDGSSTLDKSWTDSRRFTDVLEHGYLSLLRESIERCGRAPTWLQGMIIYELSWYFKTADRISPQTAGYGETLTRFHDLFGQICTLLDAAGIDGYAATRLKPVWRETLHHGYASERWHTPFAIVDKMDSRQDLVRVTYRFTGELPDERFVVYGKPYVPVHQKVRDVRFFDHAALYERIVWLPFGTIRVVLDGRDVDVRLSEPEPARYFLDSGAIREGLDPATPPAQPTEPTRKLSLGDRAVLRLARSRPVRRYFRGSWVLMDRIFNANDSAEHLFRYLREHRRKVNAWFVIERGTPDHRRMRRDGYRRLVTHGSLRWKLLMLNCQHLISSHADHPVVRPAAITRLAEPTWRFTFLQHGVIKDDLSNWLNLKDIDIFVTSTAQEQESIAGDHTAYRYTTREAKLTGLPRFDSVREQGERFPPDKRDLILIAPTWRQWLSSADKSARHSVDADTFRESDFAVQWSAFVNSPELSALAERSGLTVALLLHPNFQDTATLDVLPHVRSFGFDGENVQELFARARVLVTDYSSMAFNAAYIERPIVYFQFDQEQMFAGGHVGRRGYFVYERDGFGPVALTVDDAVADTIKAVDQGPSPAPEYLRRIENSFPQRDGRCCERAANAIAASTKPVDRRKYASSAEQPALGEQPATAAV